MSGLKLSQLAGMWSKDPTFIRYLNDQVTADCRFGLLGNEHDPADYIRSTCGIASRRELNSDSTAILLFNQRIRMPFMAWAKKHAMETA